MSSCRATNANARRVVSFTGQFWGKTETPSVLADLIGDAHDYRGLVERLRMDVPELRR